MATIGLTQAYGLMVKAINIMFAEEEDISVIIYPT